MAVVSTRPGIKVRVPVKFPARVTVQSPLVLNQVGANYDFSINLAALLGGAVTVFQLRVALKTAGNFYTVDTAIPVSPGGLVYEAWTSGGARTSYGDSLSNAIAAIIGAVATQSAYGVAAAITL